MNKYLKLIQANTNYAKRMTRLRNRIFGDVVRNTDKSSMKVVSMLSEEPIYMKNDVINYYPRHRELSALMTVLKHYGLFRDDFEEFKSHMQKLREQKGTSTPVKSFKKKPKEGPKAEIHPLEKIPLKFKVELK